MVRVTVWGPWLLLKVPAAWAGLKGRDALLGYGLSRRLWGQLQANGGLAVNGQPLRPDTVLAAGDQVALRLRGPEPYGVESQPLPLAVAYEDEHLLVAHKPPAWPVHPTPDRAGEATLAAAVAHTFAQGGEQRQVRPIHRLDVGTSGLVLFAKDALCHSLLDRALAAGRIRRLYLGLAVGTFARVEGTLRYPIGEDRHHPGRRRVSATGQPAVTHYRVLEQQARVALVQLELETGRTHQIRVHLSHVGHPLVGDPLYGGPVDHPRPALHAHRLAFTHPYSGERLQVEAPLPADLVALLRRCGVGLPSP